MAALIGTHKRPTAGKILLYKHKTDTKTPQVARGHAAASATGIVLPLCCKWQRRAGAPLCFSAKGQAASRPCAPTRPKRAGLSPLRPAAVPGPPRWPRPTHTHANHAKVAVSRSFGGGRPPGFSKHAPRAPQPAPGTPKAPEKRNRGVPQFAGGDFSAI